MRNGLILGEFIGPDECPMMQRWMLNTPVGSLRLHHFFRSDVDRDPHDHPWWFLTIVLSGSYYDMHMNGRIDKLERWSVRFRSAYHAHRVETQGCWTLVLTGRKKHDWGFWKGFKHIKEKDYFRFFKKSVACDD